MEDPKNPRPFIDEKGRVIIPLYGDYAIPCLNALLMMQPDDPPKKRKSCRTKSKKTTTRTAKKSTKR
jgi:hypothetical protein